MVGSSPIGSISDFLNLLSIDNSSRYDTTLLVTIAGFEDGKGLFLTLESTTFSLSLRLIYNFLIIISDFHSHFENCSDSFLIDDCITRKLFAWIIPTLSILSNDNDRVVSLVCDKG